MDRNILEGRFLIRLVGNIIRQDDSKPDEAELDWETLFRISDQHSMGNIVYLGLLGSRINIPETQRKQFFARYQEARRYSPSIERTQNRIFELMDSNAIPGIVLKTIQDRKLYEIKETAGEPELKILLNEDGFESLKNILYDRDFIQNRGFAGPGERLMSPDGLLVSLQKSLPYVQREYRRNMTSLLGRARPMEKFPSVRMMSDDQMLLYKIADMCYLYCIDGLTIRTLSDCFLFYKKNRSHINSSYITNRLRAFGTDEIAKALFHLAAVWFGSVFDELPQTMLLSSETYENMEKLLISMGTIGEEKLPQARLLKKENGRIRSRKSLGEIGKAEVKRDYIEEMIRLIGFLFPMPSEMQVRYPVLKRLVFLLPFFWLIRWIELCLGRDRTVEFPDDSYRTEEKDSEEMYDGSLSAEDENIAEKVPLGNKAANDLQKTETGTEGNRSSEDGKEGNRSSEDGKERNRSSESLQENMENKSPIFDFLSYPDGDQKENLPSTEAAQNPDTRSMEPLSSDEEAIDENMDSGSSAGKASERKTASTKTSERETASTKTSERDADSVASSGAEPGYSEGISGPDFEGISGTEVSEKNPGYENSEEADPKNEGFKEFEAPNWDMGRKDPSTDINSEAQNTAYADPDRQKDKIKNPDPETRKEEKLNGKEEKPSTYGAKIVRAAFERVNRDGSRYIAPKENEEDSATVRKWHFPSLEELN